MAKASEEKIYETIRVTAEAKKACEAEQVRQTIKLERRVSISEIASKLILEHFK